MVNPKEFKFSEDQSYTYTDNSLFGKMKNPTNRRTKISCKKKKKIEELFIKDQKHTSEI